MVFGEDDGFCIADEFVQPAANRGVAQISILFEGLDAEARQQVIQQKLLIVRGKSVQGRFLIRPIDFDATGSTTHRRNLHIQPATGTLGW